MTDTTLQEGPARVEGFWPYHVVTPTAEPRTKLTDASRLTFPIQTLLVIIGVFLSAFSGVWVATLGLNSRVDSIQQQLIDAAKLEALKTQLDLERAATIKEAIATLTRQQELQRYELQTVKEMFLKGDPGHVQR